jgi:hypothetical protein
MASVIEEDTGERVPDLARRAKHVLPSFYTGSACLDATLRIRRTLSHQPVEGRA